MDICYRYAGGLGSSRYMILVGGPGSVSPHGPRLVDSDLLVVSLTPRTWLTSVPQSSTSLSDL